MSTELRRLDGHNPTQRRVLRTDDPPTQADNLDAGKTGPASTGPAYYPTAETAAGARTVALNDQRTLQMQYRAQNAPAMPVGNGDKIIADYHAYKANPPHRKDFPNQYEYDEALRMGASLERAAIPHLLKRA